MKVTKAARVPAVERADVTIVIDALNPVVAEEVSSQEADVETVESQTQE